MLRITTRGRNGRTLLYRPSSAGAPPRLASHRRTIARMLATPELLPEVAAQAAAPPAGLWECSGCGAVGPLPRPAACRFCSCAL
jgi:hypothetical protein